MFSSQELRLHAYYSTEKQTGFMANTEFKNEREVSLAENYGFFQLPRFSVQLFIMETEAGHSSNKAR
jgi:hypothetical protein